LKKKYLFGIAAVAIAVLAFAFIIPDLIKNSPYSPEHGLSEDDTIAVHEPKTEYGIIVDSLEVLNAEIQNGDFLGDILDDYGISATMLDQVLKSSKNIFDVRKIRVGNPYTLIYKEDSVKRCEYFVYELNKVDYITLCFCDSVYAYLSHKPVERDTISTSGVIESSLYEALDDAGSSPELALKLANVYAWTVDFYIVQKGDAFKAIYVEEFVEGESVGIKEILCANFNYYGKDIYAFRFQQDSLTDPEYFDSEGNSLRRAFLKMPLEFGRMTSPYNKNRFHPVLKYNKPHLGTDYAAPSGTPILATGDGTVIEASYTSGNGNYVKIKHNSVYTTQYLHMKGFASGIKKGVHVAQGDVIGYVGSTGLATGPHVCYRFWKNGSQVDPRKEELPSAEPIIESNREKFEALKGKWMEKLGEIGEKPV